ncbi:hypothetical protein SAMN05444285_12567 [Draconibacterium orientale]|jgi:hypothetical protein|uniref:Uncharacterized protein n=1 Tax=Draconibacterium orientale TaxID=1168034 RepID=A0A1I0HP22_9BACT|nr:hypothetical protein SAMN05444285_12567 [Draconibacterium orientale]
MKLYPFRYKKGDLKLNYTQSGIIQLLIKAVKPLSA